MSKLQINACVLSVVAAFAIGVTFGILITSTNMHSSAIKNECAHYDPRTGEFKWGPLQ